MSIYRALLGSTAVITLALTTNAYAASVITPTVSDFSSQFTGVNQDRLNTVNNSGLSSNVISGDSLASASTVTHDTGVSTIWHSNTNRQASDEFITFDLGSVQSVGSALVWQLNTINFTTDLTNRGVQDFVIRYSTDDVTYTDLGTFTLPQSPSTAANPIDILPEFVSFGQLVNARYIEFDILSNYGGDVVGLGEVRFVNVVPEPASLALLAAGLGLVVARRRRA